MFSKFLSKKLLAMILGTTLVPFLYAKGIPAEVINYILTILGSYIGVQGLVDTVAAYKAPTAK